MRVELFGYRWLPIVLIVCFALPIVLLISNGFYTRYMADDFCTSYEALERGVFGAMDYWYSSWTGSYTDSFVKSVIGQFEPRVVALLPALIVVLWAAVSYWCFLRAMLLVPIRYPRFTAFVLTLILIYAIVDGIPNYIQSFYWLSASSAYTAPLIFLTVLVGLYFYAIYHREAPQGKLIVPSLVAVVVALVGGGLSELYSAFQMGVLLFIALVTIMTPLRKQRNVWLVLSVAIIGSVASLVIARLSPGMALRQDIFPETLPPMTILLRSLRVAITYVGTTFIYYSPFAGFCALLATGLVVFGLRTRAWLTPGQTRALLGLSVLAGLLLILAMVVPIMYAASIAPQPRHYIMAQWVIVLVWMFWGGIMGISLPHANRARTNRLPALIVGGIFAALIVLGPLALAANQWQQRPVFVGFASEWDARHALLLNSRDQAVVIPAFQNDIQKIGEVIPDLIVPCTIDYYGLQSFAETPTDA